MIETRENDARHMEDLGFEAARVLTLGYLAPVLFHEISNVLTVVSGIKQTCFRPGEPPSEKVVARLPSMIDDQVRKSESLYETLKRLAPKPPEKPGTTLFALGEELEAFLELRVRGGRIRVERRTEGADVDLGSDRVHRVKIATLCLAFAALDAPVRGHQPADISLRVRSQGEAGAELTVEYQVRPATGRDAAPAESACVEERVLAICRSVLAAEGSAEIKLQARSGMIRIRPG